jgi:hypothetical protein
MDQRKNTDGDPFTWILALIGMRGRVKTLFEALLQSQRRLT